MLKPANEAHSIKAVAFVCEFDKELSDAGMTDILSESKRFRSKLLLKQALHTMKFPLHSSSSSGMPVSNNISGYRFFTKAPDNSDKVWFEIAANRLVYCTNEYYSFDNFLAEVLHFASLGWKAQALAGGRLTRVTIEYRDEFVSDDIDWDPSELFKTNSGYLANSSMVKGEFWHSHCGFYSHDDMKVLNNIRVEHIAEGDADDDSRVYKAAITLTHTADLADPVEYSDEHQLNIKRFLMPLRAKHKEIFSEILSEQKLTDIGFKQPSMEF